MSFRDKLRALREWDKKGLLVSRVEGPLAFTEKGYVFDRRIFRICAAAIFAIGLFLFFTTPGSWMGEFYIKCDNDGQPCKNPIYHECENEACAAVNDMEILPPGFEFGNPPPKELGRNMTLLIVSAIALMVAAAVCNHLKHNKGRKVSDIFNVEDV